MSLNLFFLVLIFVYLLFFLINRHKRAERIGEALSESGFKVGSKEEAVEQYALDRLYLLRNHIKGSNKYFVGEYCGIDMCLLNLNTPAPGLSRGLYSHTVVVMKLKKKLSPCVVFPKRRLFDFFGGVALSKFDECREEFMPGYWIARENFAMSIKQYRRVLSYFLSDVKNLYVESRGEHLVVFEWCDGATGSERYLNAINRAVRIHDALSSIQRLAN
jgi:hypothetical protein